MTSRLRLLLMLLLMTMAPAGCTAISALGEASRPLDIYELRTPEVAVSAVRQSAEIVVAEPSTSGALATERILIRPAPLQAQYLPGARWADTAPVMVQTLLVRSFTATGAFSSVGRAPIATIPEFTILSELTDFQAETDAEGRTANVRVRLVVRLVRESDARVVGTRTFALVAEAGSTETEAIVAAFDAATMQLLPDIVTWTIGNAARS